MINVTKRNIFLISKNYSKSRKKFQNKKTNGKKLYVFRKLLINYSKKAGLHGIHYLTENTLHWTERLTWLILVTAATFSVMYVSFLLSHRYNTSPLSTVVESTYYHISEISYPGVSICNFNRINYKKINTAIERFIPDATNETKNTFRRLLQTFETLDFGSFDELSLVAKENVSPLDHLNLTAVWEFVMHACEELFVQCWWRIRFYNCCELFTLQKTEYGLCYSFNSATSLESRIVNRSAKNWPWRVSSYGEWSGLWITLDVMSDTKLSSSNQASGIMAMIHNPFEWPTIGNFIPAGSTTSIAIKPTAFYTSTDVRRFTPDQRQCIYEDEASYTKVMNIKGLPYLRPNCIAKCRQRYMIKYCNCIFDVYYPKGDYPVCNATGLICMSFYNDIFNNEKPLVNSIYFDSNETGMSCPCLQECYRIEYGVEIQPNLNSDGNKDNISLNIFFKSQTMLRYRKDVMFGWLDLLVAFGGVIGLCLGGSLLSIVEIFYYMTIGLYWTLKRSRSVGEKMKNYKNFSVQPNNQLNYNRLEFIN